MTHDEIKSAEAQALLNNQMFVDAFANVREMLVQQLEFCPLDNEVYRNQLVLSLQLLIQVKQDIENHIILLASNEQNEMRIN